jgi:hypothetical protein
MLKSHFVLTQTSLENHYCENEIIDVAPNTKHVQIFVTKWQLNVHQVLFSVPWWIMPKQPWGLTCWFCLLKWTHLPSCGAWSQHTKGYLVFPNYIKTCRNRGDPWCPQLDGRMNFASHLCHSWNANSKMPYILICGVSWACLIKIFTFCNFLTM